MKIVEVVHFEPRVVRALGWFDSHILNYCPACVPQTRKLLIYKVISLIQHGRYAKFSVNFQSLNPEELNSFTATHCN